MLRSKPPRRTGRVLTALLVATLGLVPLALLASPAGATAPEGPTPASTHVHLSTSTPTTGLVAGSVVKYTVSTDSPVTLQGTLKVDICDDTVDLSDYATGSFGVNGNATSCVYGSGLTGGTGLTGMTPAQYNTSFTYGGSETTSDNPPSPPNPAVSGALGFTVGTGTVTWNNTGGHSGSLTCNSSNPCALVFEVSTHGDGAGLNPVYFKQEITFAGQPGAPTGVTATGSGPFSPDTGTPPLSATAEDHQTTVSWTPPVNTGNGTINDYVITATPSPSGSALTCDAHNPVSHSFTFSVANGCPAMSNFQHYNITVHDSIAELPGAPGTSVESAPAVDVQPSPPAPTGVSATSGGTGQATVAWTAPASSQTVTDYLILAHDNSVSGAVPDFTVCSAGPGTSKNVTGLTDGHPFSFTVQAFYGTSPCGAPAGPSSAGSSAVTTTGFEIDQLIIVTRPTGSLVLSQACDTTYPRLTPGGASRDLQFAASDPYPELSDGTVPDGSLLYPTPASVAAGSCSVNLGAAKLVTGPNATPLALGAGYPTNVSEGQFFRADGTLNPVTVVNAREDAQGYTVSGQLQGDFADTVTHTHHISATALGWVMHLTDKSPPFTVPGLGTYTDDAQLDPLTATVLPASGPLNTPNPNDNAGLSISRHMLQATNGLGEVHLAADLHMLIPIQTPHGTYTALLQITAI